MRAAIYTRVSREEQTRGLSLATQEQDARAFAERMGWDVVAVYSDEGVSGASRERPELSRLLAAAEADEFDAVLVRHTDRLSRDAAFALELSQRLMPVRIFPFGEGDQSSEENRFMYGIRALVAEDERSKTRERMMRGKAEAARLGRWHGGEPPFGTRAVPSPDGRGSVLEPDPDEAAALRRVWSWVVEERVSVYEAARRLNAEGVATRRGRRWTRANLGHLLRSQRLSGRSTSWGVDIEVPTPFSPPEFAALREALGRGTARYQARGPASAYPLSGRIVCGCGAHWIGGRRKGVRWYHCSRHPSYAADGACDWDERRWVKADRIEAAVREALRREWLGDRWTIRLAALDHLASARSDEADREVARARARVADLEARYRRLVTDMAASEVDSRVLRDATAEVHEDLQAAREALARAESSLPHPAGGEWARLWEEVSKAAQGATSMAEIAEAVEPFGDRIDALTGMEEVDRLADQAREALDRGDLGEVAHSLDLRVRLTGRDTFEVEGRGTLVYAVKGRPAPGSR